jgi:hypothetical protein
LHPVILALDPTCGARFSMTVIDESGPTALEVMDRMVEVAYRDAEARRAR